MTQTHSAKKKRRRREVFALRVVDQGQKRIDESNSSIHRESQLRQIMIVADYALAFKAREGERKGLCVCVLLKCKRDMHARAKPPFCAEAASRQISSTVPGPTQRMARLVVQKTQLCACCRSWRIQKTIRLLFESRKSNILRLLGGLNVLRDALQKVLVLL